MRISDWSSDVCSSDLQREGSGIPAGVPRRDGGGPVPQCALGGGNRAARRGAPAGLRRHHPRAAEAGAQLRRIAAPARPGHVRHPVALPARRSEEHTSELQSLMRISYAVFCLKKKKSSHPILCTKFSQNRRRNRTIKTKNTPYNIPSLHKKTDEQTLRLHMRIQYTVLHDNIGHTNQHQYTSLLYTIRHV